MKLKIFLLSLFFYLVVTPHLLFAADFTVSGKILDQNNNPVPQGSVAFTDPSGKTIAAAVSDMSGFYTAAVPQGIYTVSVSGAKESHLESVTIKNRMIASSSKLDFILKAPTVRVASKSSLIQKIIIGIFGLAVLLFIGIEGFILLRKKKKSLPQPSSPN